MPTTVDHVIVENIKRLRVEKGWSQSKLGAAARAVGLNWGRGHVAAIENGARRLYLDEAIALMRAFEVSWEELARADAATVAITPVLSCSGAQLAAVLRGERAPALDVSAQQQLSAQHQPASTFTDADRKAARNLSKALDVAIDPSVIVDAANEMWGRGYDEERDRRAAERAPADADDRVLQALRAHASRELYEELIRQIEDAHARPKRARSGVQTRRSLQRQLDAAREAQTSKRRR